MRLVIIGAGGIGGYYGARLQHAGNPITLVARGEHLAALRARGLSVEHPQFRFNEAVHACALEELAGCVAPGEVDAVLVCVKATATSTVAAALARWIGPVPAAVVSLQNGVDNEAELAAVLGAARVIGGLTRRIGGHVVAPGRIEATGPAQGILGPWPRTAQAGACAVKTAARLAAAFDAAGLPTTVSDDISRELWKKLVINNGMNPLSALVRRDTRTIAHDRLLAPLVHALMQETARAAAADGVHLGDADVAEMFELIRTFDAIKTSMLVDLEHGRPLEVEAIAGAVLRRAAVLKIPVPHTRMVHALLSHLGPAPGRP